MKSKILLLSGAMPLGGASIFVINLCDGIKQLGERTAVAAVLRGECEVGQQLKAQGHTLLGPYLNEVITEDRMECLYAECCKLSPEVVVAVLGGGEAFNFLRMVPPGVLRVAMIHSDEESVYRAVEKYLPWTDLIIAVSDQIRRNMAERINISTVPIVQISCGVPISMTCRTPLIGRPMRIIYLGRIEEEQKRVSVMQKVMQKTLDSGIPLVWTIAGDGPDLPWLKSQFPANDSRINFLGAIPYNEVNSVLSQHDVYFLCSDYEGLPLSLLEAMGCGLASVVSDLPSGISEVINDGNGIRVPIHDYNGYATALEELAANPQRVNEMGRCAMNDIRKSYSNIEMARRWETVINMHKRKLGVTWPQQVKVLPPIQFENKILYHKKLKPLRRLYGRIKGFFNGKLN